jgi:small redox-active disulfide protein 2
MTKIQILGVGCPKCKKLAESAEAAAKALGIEYSMEKVTSIEAIAAAGVMFTPALVVNGVLKVSGKVPSVDEIKKLLA